VFHAFDVGRRDIRLIVNVAIQFDDELVLWTPEVEYVASYGVLPSEFHAIELSPAQRAPQFALSRRGAPPQIASSLNPIKRHVTNDAVACCAITHSLVPTPLSQSRERGGG
jgi:hypothetical protein